MLKIRNISKQFNNKTILDSVSLTVPRGTIAVLLGSSGVGKSTLLRVLNNLESIDSGTVILDETAIDLKIANKHHLVGMVFQQFNLFTHLTVEQNITLALELTTHTSHEQAVAIAHTVLRQYGLADKAALPVTRLSGGQKQRLALARLIALKPTIICLDEPTSALDPLLTNFVADAINQLAKDGYIVLVATHDVSLIEQLKCTVYLMEKGNIVESASSDDLKEHPTKYQKITQFVRGTGTHELHENPAS